MNEVCGVFDGDDGFLCFRPVGGGNKRRMAFIDYDSTQLAGKAMRKHQGHMLSSAGGPDSGLAIDFDKDPRSKRSRAMERNWGHGDDAKIQGGWAEGGGGGKWTAGTQKQMTDEHGNVLDSGKGTIQ